MEKVDQVVKNIDDFIAAYPAITQFGMFVLSFALLLPCEYPRQIRHVDRRSQSQKSKVATFFLDLVGFLRNDST